MFQQAYRIKIDKYVHTCRLSFILKENINYINKLGD